MGPDNAVVIGAALAGSGLFLWALTALFVRLRERTRASGIGVDADLANKFNSHKEGLVLLREGGRVLWLNNAARRAFDLAEDETAQLEKIARKIRPSEAMYTLCAQDGQERMILGGRPVEALSYLLPVTPQPLRVISMRFPELGAGLASEKNTIPADILGVFIELSQAVAASLDLEETLLTILENLERLVAADMREIGLWDNQNQVLVAYRMTQDENGERRLEKDLKGRAPGEGLSGYLWRERQTLVLPEVTPDGLRAYHLQPSALPLRSYLGVPLLVGGEFIGTIEFGAYSSGAFTPAEGDLVALISGQAALAIHNALLYQQEQRRIAELSGLAQLAQAFGAIRDPKNVFEQLVKIIHPLIPVQVLGFLIYNESGHALEGQEPFIGIPAGFLEMYRLPIPSGSALEKAFLDQDVLLSDDARADSRWVELGLEPIAIAAGLRETVLMPLATGGRMLGYLQAANLVDGQRGFNQDELHLLMIIANQVSPIIDNATLLLQSRQRAQRAEGLRRIASLSSSTATLDEILKFSLKELVRLLQADLAVIFLRDQTGEAIQLHHESAYGSLPETSERFTRLLTADPQYPFTATGNLHGFRLGEGTVERPLIPFYLQLINHWKIESLMVAPLVIREEGIGEIWLGSQKHNFFENSDLQVTATAASQLAAVVERGYLEIQTDETLRRRIEQLKSLNRITRELSSSLDLKYLLQLVYDEALRTTQAESGCILFFEPDSPQTEKPRIRFHIGENPTNALSPQALEVILAGAARLVEDHYSTIRGQNSGAKATLFAPIIYQDRSHGLIVLRSAEHSRFDDSALEMVQSLAAQAAIAIANALQFEEQARRGTLLQRQIDTLNRLYSVAKFLRPEMALEDGLGAVCQAIVEATPFRTVLISVYDRRQDGLRRVKGIGLSPEIWEELRARLQPWRGILRLLDERFKIGGLYYIPANEQPLIPEEVHSVAILPVNEQRVENTWDADDFLLAPLFGGDGQPLGLISVDDPRDGRRPDKSTLDTLEIFAIQAALLIENHNHREFLLARVEDKAAGSDLAKIPAQAEGWQVDHSAHGLTAERAAALSGADSLAIMGYWLDISREVSQKKDMIEALTHMADAMLEFFGMQTALIAESRPSGFRLLGISGSPPDKANLEALFGQRNPLRQTLQDSQLLLIERIENSLEWQDSAMLTELKAVSLVVFPFHITPGMQAAILACGRQPLPSISAQDRQLYNQVCRQVSVGLQKLELLAQTRQRLAEVDQLLAFSQKLGSLDQTSILTALLDSAMEVISGASAAWVGLLDEEASCIAPVVSRGYADNASLELIRYPLDAEHNTLPGQVVRAAQPMVVNDIDFAFTYRLPPEDLLLYRAATRGRLPESALAVPVQHGGRVSGVLVMENFDRIEPFGEEHRNLAASLAQQAALALENARLFHETCLLKEDLEKRVEERTGELMREHRNSQTMLRVTTELSASMDIQQVMQRSLAVLNEALQVDTSLIMMANEQAVYGAGGLFPEMVSNGFEALAGHLHQRVIGQRQPLMLRDVSQEKEWQRLGASGLLVRSVLGVPLILGQEVLGSLLLWKREADHFTPEHIGLLQGIARQIAITLNNAELFNLIRDQSEHLGTLLREQQIEASRSRAILEAVADGVLVTDSQARITLFNGSAERMLEIRADRVIGKPLNDLEGLLGAAASSWRAAIQKWTDEPAGVHPGQSLADQITFGNQHIIAIHLAPVIWRSEFLGTVSIFRDITQEVQVDQLKSEFIANVSHELRTPLTSIKGYVEVLLMGAGGEINDQQAHFLKIVRENSDRLIGLVNNLLDVSRIQSGRVMLDVKELDLGALADEVIAGMRQRSQETGKAMNFTLEVEAALPPVLADIERTRQVLRSLVSNSYNYTPEGGQVCLRVLRAGQGEVQVDVRDTGIGIPLEDQPRIFDRFFRGDDPLVMATAGTGLGLSLSKILVEMQGGRIWFHSKGIPGEGSIFSFTLPVVPDKE